MTTLKQSRLRWEEGFAEVSHIGDSLVLLVVIKKEISDIKNEWRSTTDYESIYSCHRYINLGSTKIPDWDCSVDRRDVTAEECLRWAFQCFKVTLIVPDVEKTERLLAEIKELYALNRKLQSIAVGLVDDA